jgi:carbon-monoxide dehydrogenase small subunit
MKVTLKVNGRLRTADVEPRKTLLDTLREDFLLTGSHAGCEHGVCGACTVLIDGEPSRACLMFAVQADGYEITTIEGIAPGPGELSLVQDAFCETHGLQCGYCTPGMILSAHALLERNDAPTRGDIVEAISGNICRCTGYGQIVEAIDLAAERLRRTNVPRHLNGADLDKPSRDPAAETDAPEHGVIEAARVEAPHGGGR